jgi:hypothetical protein
MLSTFHVTDSVWFPERWTVVLAASVNTRLAVEHVAASAVHVATALNDEEFSVPDDPVAFVQVAAFHVTSLADHVVAPTTGGVNELAAAWTETLSCFVAVANTMLSTVTDAAGAAVLLETFPTRKVTDAGTMTRACSLTFAVRIVIWLVSGRNTVT